MQETKHKKENKAEPLTRGIKNCRVSRLFKGCSPLQPLCNLTGNRPQSATFHTANVTSNVKMTTKTTILTLFILTFSFAYGQNPQVKKNIAITTTFDYDYIQDGKLYLSKKGKVKQDTLITEFNLDGTLTKPIKSNYETFSKTTYRDSLVLLSNSYFLKHEREYWSDSTSIDIYTQIFKD
jgi:hypothetical protein